jgi:hypothetical protein
LERGRRRKADKEFARAMAEAQRRGLIGVGRDLKGRRVIWLTERGENADAWIDGREIANASLDATSKRHREAGKAPSHGP